MITTTIPTITTSRTLCSGPAAGSGATTTQPIDTNSREFRQRLDGHCPAAWESLLTHPEVLAVQESVKRWRLRGDITFDQVWSDVVTTMLKRPIAQATAKIPAILGRLAKQTCWQIQRDLRRRRQQALPDADCHPPADTPVPSHRQEQDEERLEQRKKVEEFRDGLRHLAALAACRPKGLALILAERLRLCQKLLEQDLEPGQALAQAEDLWPLPEGNDPDLVDHRQAWDQCVAEVQNGTPPAAELFLPRLGLTRATYDQRVKRTRDHLAKENPWLMRFVPAWEKRRSHTVDIRH